VELAGGHPESKQSGEILPRRDVVPHVNIAIAELERRRPFILGHRHPRRPLTIWNYTPECELAKAWDEYTSLARGLITDRDGRVHSRPFPKFFNLNSNEQSRLENLPAEPPRIYEKVDGTLGILYWDGDLPCIATRGSFESPLALWASRWLQAKVNREGLSLRAGFTYLFEIIHPMNRILVDYGSRRELVLLAVIELETGTEQDPIAEAQRLGFSHPQVSAKSLTEVIAQVDSLGPKEEGFVAVYNNGLRVKIKGRKYLSPARRRGVCSRYNVWKCLSGGGDFRDYLAAVPDEFYAWLGETRNSLEDEYLKIERSVSEAFGRVSQRPDRRTKAQMVQSDFGPVAPAVFALLDGKDPVPYMWRLIRPSTNFDEAAI
jgi:RNA ligase